MTEFATREPLPEDCELQDAGYAALCADMDAGEWHDWQPAVLQKGAPWCKRAKAGSGPVSSMQRAKLACYAIAVPSIL